MIILMLLRIPRAHHLFNILLSRNQSRSIIPPSFRRCLPRPILIPGCGTLFPFSRPTNLRTFYLAPVANPSVLHLHQNARTSSLPCISMSRTNFFQLVSLKPQTIFMSRLGEPSNFSEETVIRLSCGLIWNLFHMTGPPMPFLFVIKVRSIIRRFPSPQSDDTPALIKTAIPSPLHDKCLPLVKKYDRLEGSFITD